MIIDFQHHYTPPELMETGGVGILRLDEHGNPNYKFNPLLADLPAHIRMMDRAGIDVAVLSYGTGFDQPKLDTCRLINDRICQAQRDYPGRFIGLAHVPALDAAVAVAELKRCAVELDFPGVVVASEVQGQALDADACVRFGKRAKTSGCMSLSIRYRESLLGRRCMWTTSDACWVESSLSWWRPCG